MNEMKLLAQEMQGFLFVLPPKALEWPLAITENVLFLIDGLSQIPMIKSMAKRKSQNSSIALK